MWPSILLSNLVETKIIIRSCYFVTIFKFNLLKEFNLLEIDHVIYWKQVGSYLAGPTHLYFSVLSLLNVVYL